MGKTFFCSPYKGIIIFLNRRCSVGCSSCNVAAHPLNSEGLSPDWISKFFPLLKTYSIPRYITWTGGEPFLSPETLIKGVQLASQEGYHSEILTSGIWHHQFPNLLHAFLGIKNISIRISLDAEHQDKIPVSHIIELIGNALELNIEIAFTIRRIPNTRDPVLTTLGEIQKAFPHYFHLNSTRSRWIHFIPHIPMPFDNSLSPTSHKDVSNYNEKRIFTKPTPKQKQRKPCQMVYRDFVIGEDGLLYPCCGFFSLPNEIRKKIAYGNPLNETFRAIMKSMGENPILKFIKEKGPYQLGIKESFPIEELESLCHNNMCSLCLSIFSKYGECLFEGNGYSD